MSRIFVLALAGILVLGASSRSDAQFGPLTHNPFILPTRKPSSVLNVKARRAGGHGSLPGAGRKAARHYGDYDDGSSPYGAYRAYRPSGGSRYHGRLDRNCFLHPCRRALRRL